MVQPTNQCKSPHPGLERPAGSVVLLEPFCQLLHASELQKWKVFARGRIFATFNRAQINVKNRKKKFFLGVENFPVNLFFFFSQVIK